MALAIVPLDRNSGLSCPEQPTPLDDCIVDVDDIPFDIPRSPVPLDDLDALTHELEETEGLSAVEARSQALALTHELATFAAVWDADVFLDGNPAAAPARPHPEPITSIYLPQPLGG